MNPNDKVLLVNPPFYRLLGSKYNANSLGLAYTAAAYKKAGYRVAIYNADFSSENYSNLQNIFKNEKNYLNHFKDENHPIWTEVVNTILEYGPHIIGYTCYTANLPTIEIISKKINKIDKSIKQIVGGPHFRLNTTDKVSSWLTSYPFESENLLGLDNIDAFPFPERESFWGVTEKQKKEIDLSYIMTSRGCPYKCTFCANPNMWNNKVRFRCPDSVLSEMKEMKNKYSINEFYILDDTFTLKKKRVKEILNKIIKEELKITWKCNTRLDRIDDEVCRLMKESGCIEAKVGIESGSEKTLKTIKKGETKEDMRRGIGLLKKYNIPITAYFIAGFPEETDEDLKETIDFAKEICIDRYSLSIFAPYYGSDIYYELEKSNKIDKMAYQYFYHQATRPIANNKISDKMLEQYFSLSELNKEKEYKK